MTSTEKIIELKQTIVNALTPLIDNDYVYLDLPYYSNIGDSLIWLGTEDYLKTIPYRCLYRCSYTTFEFKPLNSDVVILLQGGGNFGDIYPCHQQFRNKIIEAYPNNRIIILPQTVYYYGSRMLANDSILMRKHKNLYICARDQYSFDFLKRYRFGKKILLVPDMAFCIDFGKLQEYVSPQTDRVLLFKRVDKEKSATNDIVPEIYDNVLDVKDWVGYENNTDEFSLLYNLIKGKEFAKADEYAINTYLPGRIKDGIEMISPYKCVYSNRLHGAILSVLLGKEVTIIDNSYGKNSQFYATWLCNIPTIHIHKGKQRINIKRTFRLCITWVLSQMGIRI